ncbi:hypothetical protein [Buchananella hordeovulneris]|nr:hypothetical protein [Buchananella hordeovulneris]
MRKTLTATALLATLAAGCTALTDSTAQAPAPSAPLAPATPQAPLPAASAPETASAVQAPAITKDRAKWTLPTDPYYGWQERSLSLHAYSLVIAPCMAQNGFPDYQVIWDSNAPRSEFLAGSGNFQVLTPAAAQRFGYRRVTEPGDLVPQGAYADKSDAFHEQIAQCEIANEDILLTPQEKAYVPQPLPEQAEDFPGPQTPEEEAGSLLNRLSVDTNTGELPAAADRWRQCMAPLGIPDLPAEPWLPAMRHRMPPSLLTRWNWQPGGQPSADEIEVATHDANCRETSGWQAALYDAEWELHTNFITQHGHELAPRLADLKAREDHYRQIIANHHP